MAAFAVGSYRESSHSQGAEMTQSYGTPPPYPVQPEQTGVGPATAQAGGRVAQTAADKGKEVVRETREQARGLVNEASGELTHQASMQQKRAAEGLRSLGSQLHSMAGGAEQPG